MKEMTLQLISQKQKNITRKYYEQLNTNKLVIVNEMGKFLKIAQPAKTGSWRNRKSEQINS